MRTLALLSLAAPGAIAGYMVLTGYLIAKIRPVPIVFMQDDSSVLELRIPRRDVDLDDEPRAVAV